MKKRIEHPSGYNNGADTAYTDFILEGKEYTVCVTSNRELLTASLWRNGKCLESVMGKDGILFADQPLQ